MKKFLVKLSFAILIGILSQNTLYAKIRLESLGEIGGGIFLPTGSDQDVAGTSPAFQLVGSIRFSSHLGAEAEFLYVPILFKQEVLSSFAHRKGTQITALTGLRITTDQFLDGEKPAVGYLSLRAGFSRIVIRSDTGIPAGSWIGRPLDELENPDIGSSSSTTARQKGLALSPKFGLLFRMTNNTALDLAFHPLLIFDRGDVSTQLFFTLNFALSSWQFF